MKFYNVVDNVSGKNDPWDHTRGRIVATDDDGTPIGVYQWADEPGYCHHCGLFGHPKCNEPALEIDYDEGKEILPGDYNYWYYRELWLQGEFARVAT